MVNASKMQQMLLLSVNKNKVNNMLPTQMLKGMSYTTFT
jgi:hypothetical protein